VLEAREGQQGNPEGTGRSETEKGRQKVGREPTRDSTQGQAIHFRPATWTTTPCWPVFVTRIKDGSKTMGEEETIVIEGAPIAEAAEPVEESQEKLVQQRIPGTFDPPDPAVQEAAQEYVELLTSRMAIEQKERVARATLLERMHEHDVQECELDGYIVKIISTNKEKITVKKTESAEAVFESAD